MRGRWRHHPQVVLIGAGGALMATLVAPWLVLGVLGVLAGVVLAVFILAILGAVFLGPLAMLGWAGVSMFRHRRNRVRHVFPPPPPPQRSPWPAVQQLPQQNRWDSLPEPGRSLARRIQRRGQELLARRESNGDGTIDLLVVRRMLDDYLPSTVGAYLSLPPHHPDAPITSDGRSSRQLLTEQLTLLDRKLDEVAEGMLRHDLEGLLANGRFLEEQFGHHESELTLPRND